MQAPSLTERRVLYGLVERGMAALSHKGSAKCRKQTRALDETFSSDNASDEMQAYVFGEVRLVLRARCGLCEYRAKCKGRLV